MKINFKFNSKSRSQNILEAKKLAEKYGGVLEGNFYSINFDSPDNKNLEKLFNLVGRLKGSVISIDGGEPLNANKFFYAVNCQNKLLCKGICSHVTFGYTAIDQFNLQYGNYINEGVLSTSDLAIIRYLSKFLEQIDETHFKVNQKLFVDYFENETKLESEFCTKYSLEKAAEEINKLPEKIELISRDEYYEKYEEEGYEDESKIIRDVLVNSEINSKLSIEEILECSRTISLIFSAPRGNIIQDTDVIVYSLPYFKQHILVKLIVNEDAPELSEDEEIVDIVLKENEFFCIKSSYLELYFKAFKEGDLKAEKYYNYLKRL